MFGNHSGQDVITSLSFVKNVTEYGPFGTRLGTFISTLVENGVMVEFQGRAGDFLNSIGFYKHSKIPCICQIPEQEQEYPSNHFALQLMLTLSVRPPPGPPNLSEDSSSEKPLQLSAWNDMESIIFPWRTIMCVTRSISAL